MPVVVLVALCLSVTATWYYYSQKMTVAFTDAAARLLLGRSITDATNPGPQQCGGIWPCGPQVAMQPWIQIDALYTSGLAGVIPQMICYVVGAVTIYRLAKLYNLCALCAAVAFLVASNPNILAMQSVPMAETMFNAFMVLGVYFLARWEMQRDEYKWLLFSGGAVWGACYTRYEGYVLAAFMFVLVIAIGWHELRGQQKTVIREGVIAHAFIFAFPVAVGLVVWLLYSGVYFHDVLYFLRSQYSPWAVAQESLSYVDEQYKTEGKLLLSFKVYSRTVLDNVGLIPIALGLIGVITFLASGRRITQKAVPFVLLFPFPFFVLALYQGSSVVIWHPDYMLGANWATRYGIMMIPGIALFASLAVAKLANLGTKLSLKVKLMRPFESGLHTAVTVVLVGLIIATSVAIGHDGPISMGEARANQLDEETQAQRSAGEWLDEAYDNGQGIVLMQRANSAWIAADSGVDLRDIISENTPTSWNIALHDPVAAQVDWIVMRKALRTGKEDEVWQSLHGTDLLDTYILVYDEQGVKIYRRV